MLVEKVHLKILDSEQLAWFDDRAENRRLAGFDQLRWLEETLAASTADFLIVAGHYPILSGGEHGSTPSLQTTVKPLLEKYGVDAYLAGHDHTLQHLESNGVQYYVSGGGALRGAVKPLPETLFAAVAPGFTLHQVDCADPTWQGAAAGACTLTTTFFDAATRPLYQHAITGTRDARKNYVF
ncbi:Metallo-dependent phosphatase-like protein [Baffinella frigidus]|nr:Metallo-dependent phosphatase-like protein [Cryptophyta sp. CCMP2293]